MPTIKIDGIEIQVEAGISVLQAALDHGIDIPHYCYHPALPIMGSCRLCLVEITGSPKLVPSCATVVADGMSVQTNTDQVKDARKSMLEFFLINHPLDCPICDKAGECLLQDYTFKYGSAHSRFLEEKRVRPTKDLGGNILLYRNRCVLCSRCVRFFETVVGEPYLTVEDRGYHSDISIFPGKELTHPMTGNIVEICPVGCLIDKDFLFHSRVWNLTRSPSICPGCSSGCNIFLEHKDNQIYRIRSRDNPSVNNCWLCDDGRYFYHRYENFDRLQHPKKRSGNRLIRSDWQKAIVVIYDHLKQLKHCKKLAVVGSACASNEENYLLYKICHDELGCEKFFVHRPQPVGEDVVYKNGFTVRADKSPNWPGATLLLGTAEDFWTGVQKGEIKTLIFLGKDVELQLTERQKKLLQKLDFLVVLDCTVNELVEQADVVLPLATFAEQAGSFINVQGRLQKFAAALTPPLEAQPGWQVLLNLYRAFQPQLQLHSVAEVFNDLAKNVPAFAGMTYFKLTDQGIQIGRSE